MIASTASSAISAGGEPTVHVLVERVDAVHGQGDRQRERLGLDRRAGKPADDHEDDDRGNQYDLQGVHEVSRAPSKRRESDLSDAMDRRPRTPPPTGGSRVEPGWTARGIEAAAPWPPRRRSPRRMSYRRGRMDACLERRACPPPVTGRPRADRLACRSVPGCPPSDRRPAPGSTRRSPHPPRPRPRPGRRSAPASTPWSSRRPAPARRWPRSCGRSTGWPPRGNRPTPPSGAACST